MKIGLSLSFCVKDMIRSMGKEGDRKEPLSTQDIKFIISGTSIRNDAEFKEALEHYSSTYWIMDPQLACYLAQELWDEGKIHQPKLDSEDGCTMPSWHRELIGQGIHWLTVDERRK